MTKELRHYCGDGLIEVLQQQNGPISVVSLLHWVVGRNIQIPIMLPVKFLKLENIVFEAFQIGEVEFISLIKVGQFHLAKVENWEKRHKAMK